MNAPAKKKNPALDPDGTLPKIPGWIALTEVGEWLGLSRQHVYKMAATKKFKTLARLGDSHITAVETSEVQAMMLARADTPEN